MFKKIEPDEKNVSFGAISNSNTPIKKKIKVLKMLYDDKKKYKDLINKIKQPYKLSFRNSVIQEYVLTNWKSLPLENIKDLKIETDKILNERSALEFFHRLLLHNNISYLYFNKIIFNEFFLIAFSEIKPEKIWINFDEDTSNSLNEFNCNNFRIFLNQKYLESVTISSNVKSVGLSSLLQDYKKRLNFVSFNQSYYRLVLSCNMCEIRIKNKILKNKKIKNIFFQILKNKKNLSKISTYTVHSYDTYNTNNDNKYFRIKLNIKKISKVVLYFLTLNSNLFENDINLDFDVQLKLESKAIKKYFLTNIYDTCNRTTTLHYHLGDLYISNQRLMNFEKFIN